MTARTDLHKETAYRCAAESIVLLENDGVLPLKDVRRIALFGPGARHTLYGGGGSGAITSLHPVSIYNGLLDAGYKVTSGHWLDRYEGLWQKAEKGAFSDVRRALFSFSPNKIAQAIMDELPLPELDVTQSFIESAPADAAIYVLTRQSCEGRDRTLTPGSYYLTDGEKDSIRRLSRAYNKFILVINAGAQIDMGFMNDLNHINAVIFMGQPGCMAGRALADVLSGDVNPSGRLADTWPVKYSDILFNEEFADPETTHYKEGKLVGYRYFDAAGIPVRYPFGFGLSYTEFGFSEIMASLEGTRVTVYVTVKNIGFAAGKEVVQVYASRSFVPGKGEPKVLVGFAKTGIIPPAGSEDVAIEFDVEDLATYREADRHFRADAGEYAIYVGQSVSDTCPPLAVTLPEVSFVTRIEEPQREVSARSIRADAHAENILAQMSLEDKIEMCVGTGITDTAMPSPAHGSVGHTSYRLAPLGVNNLELSDGPSGLRLQTKYGLYPDGNCKMITPQFAKLAYLPSPARKYIFADRNKCQVIEQDVTAFPIETCMAQTWNLELLWEEGIAVSEEMSEFNVAFWLSPAIHRNPLCGRNFEYYSEDPILAGKCAAALILGVQSIPGHIAVIKHFCCNNQETNRMHSDSVTDEATLRDIYLKVFEIAIRLGAPKGLMTSYNKVNGVHSAENPMIEEVLRGEWKYDGIIMTDWTSSMVTKADRSLAAGVDLIMPGSKRDIKDIRRAIEKKKTLTEDDLDEKCRRILRAYFDYTLE